MLCRFDFILIAGSRHVFKNVCSLFYHIAESVYAQPMEERFCFKIRFSTAHFIHLDLRLSSNFVTNKKIYSLPPFSVLEEECVLLLAQQLDTIELELRLLQKMLASLVIIPFLL